MDGGSPREGVLSPGYVYGGIRPSMIVSLGGKSLTRSSWSPSGGKTWGVLQEGRPRSPSEYQQEESHNASDNRNLHKVLQDSVRRKSFTEINLGVLQEGRLWESFTENQQVVSYRSSSDSRTNQEVLREGIPRNPLNTLGFLQEGIPGKSFRVSIVLQITGEFTNSFRTQ
ncbi:hypothetical protein E2C01_100655 [Portunus trituberculatus]|uniref:Uncharacterized protein n=1 Tax=Portunus trituberculatus TaxID=210409 RepID=A0A5B7K7G7_PORTR|nr:hypothetical protein [Portunus trituberculatus]